MNKRMIVLLAAVILYGNAKAQQQASLKDLTGTWKVFSMNIPDEMYFNMEKDTIWLKGDSSEDSSMAEFKKTLIKESLKGQVDKMQFLMDANGHMYEGTNTSDETKKMGEYNPEKGILQLKEKAGAGEEKKEIQLLLKENVLTMITIDKGTTVTIQCRKAS